MGNVPKLSIFFFFWKWILSIFLWTKWRASINISWSELVKIKNTVQFKVSHRLTVLLCHWKAGICDLWLHTHNFLPLIYLFLSPCLPCSLFHQKRIGIFFHPRFHFYNSRWAVYSGGWPTSVTYRLCLVNRDRGSLTAPKTEN